MTPPASSPTDLFRGSTQGQTFRELPPVTPGLLSRLVFSPAARAGRWLSGSFRWWIVDTVRRLIDVALQVAGLGLLAGAAYLLHPIAGYGAAGVALLVLQVQHRQGTVTVDRVRILAMLDAARAGATNDQILNPPPPPQERTRHD